jgi:hypothetical protein
VAGHLGGALARLAARGGRFHGERHRQVHALRVGQIGAHCLGEQRVPVAQAAGLAVHEAGVHHPALGFGLGGERADLGGRERATGEGDRFGELPRRVG